MLFVPIHFPYRSNSHAPAYLNIDLVIQTQILQINMHRLLQVIIRTLPFSISETQNRNFDTKNEFRKTNVENKPKLAKLMKFEKNAKHFYKNYISWFFWFFVTSWNQKYNYSKNQKPSKFAKFKSEKRDFTSKSAKIQPPCSMFLFFSNLFTIHAVQIILRRPKLLLNLFQHTFSMAQQFEITITVLLPVFPHKSFVFRIRKLRLVIHLFRFEKSIHFLIHVERPHNHQNAWFRGDLHLKNFHERNHINLQEKNIFIFRKKIFLYTFFFSLSFESFSFFSFSCDSRSFLSSSNFFVLASIRFSLSLLKPAFCFKLFAGRKEGEALGPNLKEYKFQWKMKYHITKNKCLQYKI